MSLETSAGVQSDLDALAKARGIDAIYVDALGVERAAPRSTVERLVARMGSPDPHVPKPVLVRHCDASRGSLSLPGVKAWKVTNAAGHLWEGTGTAAGPADLPLGRYRLEAAHTDGSLSVSHLHVVPASAYMPPALGERGRAWGISTQLYSLRSDRNWGMGDFADLRVLLDGAADAGAAYVGLSPLHALFWDAPDQCSPYAPASRLFLNPLYLAVADCDDYDRSGAARAIVESPAFAARLAHLRTEPLVNHAGAAAAKAAVLELLFADVARHHAADPHGREARAFATYRAERGETLHRFATFQVLRQHLGGHDWRHWPAEFRHAEGRDVAAFAREHAARVDFFAWLQWQAEKQLAACQAHALDRGMPIGLYLDLAVGVASDGADTWIDRDLYVEDMRIGAPPDLWNRKGQDWGLLPWHPEHLAARGYSPLVDLLAANMRHAGALRIDHALGLMRQFWVPVGEGAADGAYVRFPFDDLLGVVALESRTQRCVVVGEDLGTVPPGFSEALMARGILSYRLALFERDATGGARAPADYPLAALVAAGTHDLPTLAGYWSGADLVAKRVADAYPDADAASADEQSRPADIERLLERLRAEGLIGSDPPTIEGIVLALYRMLAASPSRLLLVQIEDPLGVVEQANLPGTVTEHPNWRRKLPLSVDAIFDDVRVQRLCAMLRQERPPPRHAPLDREGDEA